MGWNVNSLRRLLGSLVGRLNLSIRIEFLEILIWMSGWKKMMFLVMQLRLVTRLDILLELICEV